MSNVGFSHMVASASFEFDRLQWPFVSLRYFNFERSNKGSVPFTRSSRSGLTQLVRLRQLSVKAVELVFGEIKPPAKVVCLELGHQLFFRNTLLHQ